MREKKAAKECKIVENMDLWVNPDRDEVIWWRTEYTNEGKFAERR